MQLAENAPSRAHFKLRYSPPTQRVNLQRLFAFGEQMKSTSTELENVEWIFGVQMARVLRICVCMRLVVMYFKQGRRRHSFETNAINYQLCAFKPPN